MPESAVTESERVLVVPTEVFHRLGHFQGFCPDVSRYLEELLRPEHFSFRPREQVESDPTFKQLIPYVIFRHAPPEGEPALFQYTRGAGQGEGRLHEKRSVGVGGHISQEDVAEDADNPYLAGMRREVDEEVSVQTPCRQRLVGLINDDQTPVGRVHLGLVHIFDVERPAVAPREEDILRAEFRPVSKLLGELAEFETWSQICLKELFGDCRVRT